MDDIIHFRTKFSRWKWIWSASKYTSGRSPEASEIRSVHDFDDARDIVWKKSTGTTIYKKNRTVTTSIDVTLVLTETLHDREKLEYFEYIKNKIEISCRFTRDNFFYFENKIANQNNPKIWNNHLVIILTSSIEVTEYQKWIKEYVWNDILFLMVYHPYEIDTQEGYLFESHIPKDSYYREMQIRLREIEKTLHSSWISNILLRTTDNIALKLNHFFKYRYG